MSDKIAKQILILAKSLLPQKKWKKLNSKELKEYQESVFKLIQNAYKSIGGHFDFRSKGDVNTSDVNVWMVIDLDDDDEPDAVMFGKSRKGIKFTGIGHDGTSNAKREVLKERRRLMKGGGHWSEMSGKLAEIFLQSEKYSVPYVSDPKIVKSLLPGKEVEWIGEIPKYPGIDGWYKRNIGGDKHLKIIVGTPK